MNLNKAFTGDFRNLYLKTRIKPTYINRKFSRLNELLIHMSTQVTVKIVNETSSVYRT
jgi:hypothetical protein